MARFDLARLIRELGPQLQNMGPEIAPILEQLSQTQAGQGDETTPGQPSKTDKVQNILDIIGIIDPSPAVDTVNAIISLVRAGKSSNPAEKRRHMTNAGISAIAGFLPYIGDFAKLGRQSFRQTMGGMRRGPGGPAGPVPPPVQPTSGGLGGGVIPPPPPPPVSGAPAVSGPAGQTPGGQMPYNVISGGVSLLAGIAGGMAFGALVKSVTEMPPAIMRWGQSLKDSQEHLKNFSGLLAHTYQQSQVREMLRNIGSAERTGGTTTDLVGALDDLRDDLQPYKDLFTNVSNKIAAFGLKILDGVLKVVEKVTPLDEITDMLNKLMADHDGKKPAAFEMMDSIRKLPLGTTRKPRI